MACLEETCPRIYLTGFMGSGKSTVGQILANVLGYDFMDLDAEIARLEGMGVGEIFRHHGEAYFRMREREMLEATAAFSHVVIATGGGTLARPEHMAWALRHGVVVYLILSADDLIYRLKRIRNRPLLLDDAGEPLPPEVLRQRVEALLAEREPVYRMAQVHVPTGRLPVGRTVDRVVRALRRYARKTATASPAPGETNGDDRG